MFVHESKYQIRQVFFELIVSPFFLGISATFGMVPISFLLPGGVGQLLVRRSLERRGMPSSTVLEGRVGPLLSEMTSWLGGGLTYFFNFHPYSGKWSSLTNICQMSWNHQLDDVSWAFFLLGATFEEIWLKPPRMYTKPCRTNSANQIRWYIL